MAGYHHYSMSNNAILAYAHGEKPLSKWRKSDILEAAEAYLTEQEDSAMADKMSWLRAMPLSALKSKALTKSSWHHTSKHYNETDFYSVNEYFLDELTEEDTVAAKADAPAVPAKKMGTIFFLEWGGTRKHPRAFERSLEHVMIEEKGCFYLVFDKAGKLVLRKKIGSNGTMVKYL